MNDFVFMHILQADNNIGNKKLCFSFIKETFIPKMITQVSSIQIVHNQVQMLTILKSISHINQKRMIQFT